MTFWLSVIMPIHGGAALLGATLASVAAEAPEGVELRLYNSADDDGAARSVAHGFADRLDIVWQDRPDLKPWTAKTNLGVAQARAPHVVMLHQDDIWLPGHLAAVRKTIAEDGDAVMSVASSQFIGPAGQDIGRWRIPFAPGRHQGRAFAQTLIVQNTIAIPSPVIAREAWLAVGGLDDALWFSADWELYLKLAARGDVVVRDRDHRVSRAWRIADHDRKPRSGRLSPATRHSPCPSWRCADDARSRRAAPGADQRRAQLRAGRRGARARDGAARRAAASGRAWACGRAQVPE
jgi:glycosyltransferase involved in cell wall biosynthesis